MFFTLESISAITEILAWVFRSLKALCSAASCLNFASYDRSHLFLFSANVFLQAFLFLHQQATFQVLKYESYSANLLLFYRFLIRLTWVNVVHLNIFVLHQQVFLSPLEFPHELTIFIFQARSFIYLAHLIMFKSHFSSSWDYLMLS